MACLPWAVTPQIFAVSENHTYHAYAWLKLFNFTVREHVVTRAGMAGPERRLKHLPWWSEPVFRL